MRSCYSKLLRQPRILILKLSSSTSPFFAHLPLTLQSRRLLPVLPHQDRSALKQMVRARHRQRRTRTTQTCRKVARKQRSLLLTVSACLSCLIVPHAASAQVSSKAPVIGELTRGRTQGAGKDGDDATAAAAPAQGDEHSGGRAALHRRTHYDKKYFSAASHRASCQVGSAQRGCSDAYTSTALAFPPGAPYPLCQSPFRLDS